MPRLKLAMIAATAALTLVTHATHAQLAPQDPTRPTVVLQPDLMASLDQTSRVVFSRVSMIVSGDGTTAFRPIVDMAQCAGLTAGQFRNVNVPPLRWGVQNGLVGAANPTGAAASQFAVSLSYTTVTNNLVAEVTATEAIDRLVPGVRRLFDFRTPGRPTVYSVSLFTEPARTLSQNRPTSGTKPNLEPVRLRTFCVPSIDIVDRAMVISADAAGRVNDSNRSNNILRIQ